MRVLFIRLEMDPRLKCDKSHFVESRQALKIVGIHFVYKNLIGESTKKSLVQQGQMSIFDWVRSTYNELLQEASLAYAIVLLI